MTTLSHDVAFNAQEAAYHYLALVDVSGYSSDTEWVHVHVDGYGDCTVRIAEDHE